VTSASRLYRLFLALGGLGLAAVVGVLATAIVNASWSPGAVVVICQQILGPVLTALLAVAVLGVVRGSRAAARELRARPRPPSIGEVDVAGTRVAVVRDDAPRAFCAGYLRPRVHLSDGALACLTEDQLRAVVAHEAHHARRRDPLRLLVARVLGEALFFLPAVRRLAARYEALAELAADEAAARETDAATLASALLAFGEDPARGVVVGVSPERVDHLLGERPRWRVPLAALSLAACALAFVAAVLVASASWPGHELSGTVLLAQLCATAPLSVPAALLLARRRVRRWVARR
jgi:peptidase M48-like protein